jgi:hypothetical protein
MARAGKEEIVGALPSDGADRTYGEAPVVVLAASPALPNRCETELLIICAVR